MIDTMKAMILILLGQPRLPYRLEQDARRVRDEAAKTRRTVERGKTELHGAFDRLAAEKPEHAEPR